MLFRSSLAVVVKATTAGPFQQIVSTYAGSTQGYLDGNSATAKFYYTMGIAVDASGNIFVIDDGRIRKITPAGMVSTFAGDGTTGYLDGIGIAAKFNNPLGLTIDASGNLFVAEHNGNRIRKITPTGVVTTVAGDGTTAILNNPWGITIDKWGNLFVTEPASYRIRKVTPAGVVSTFAGDGTRGYLDATGIAAKFGLPEGITIDTSGNLFVADNDNNNIRKITPTGVVTTFAGSTQGYLDGVGTSAKFILPDGITIDASGNLFVQEAYRIRKITKDAVVTTIAGDGTAGHVDGVGPTAKFSQYMNSITVDASGNLFVADIDYVRKITTISNANPIISSQSTKIQCINGTFDAITVAAIGTNITYQWFSNTTASNSGGISLGTNNGAQTNSYTPQTATLGTMYYYCVVTGDCGTATSAVSGAFIVTAPPSITSFSPASGAIGSSVTITGSGFNATAAQNIVFFGATMATVTEATTTSLTVTVPTGATYQYISVTNLAVNLTAYSAKPFIVTFEGNIAFAPKATYSTGSGSRSESIGDLDGDGKSDWAVTNLNGNTVSVFRNTSSSGTFSFVEADISTGTGTNPYSVCIGDIDGDGKPDLVVTNYLGSKVSVFRNTSTVGTISFAAKVDFTVGTNSTSVRIGDIDGDGKPDLAVANYSSTTVSVLRNTSTSGAVSFATKVDLTTGTNPVSVSIGDIDGDGKPDLAIANYGISTVSVFRNTSTSGILSFSAKVDFTTGTNP